MAYSGRFIPMSGARPAQSAVERLQCWVSRYQERCKDLFCADIYTEQESILIKPKKVKYIGRKGVYKTMEDLFGLLTTSQWLAVLRIGVGLWWLKSFLHKPHRRFVSGQMVNWTLALADNHPLPGYGRLIRGLVAPNTSWFHYLILLGELGIGLGMVFGFLTPITLIVAVLLNLNYLSLAGVRPKDLAVNPAYQCEQGQNWNMIVSEVVLFFLSPAAGCTWSL